MVDTANHYGHRTPLAGKHARPQPGRVDRHGLRSVGNSGPRASERSREIAAGFDLDDIRTHPRVGDVSLRFIYLLVIEDFARHAGHGDILTEQIEHGVPTTDVSGLRNPAITGYS